MTLNMVATHNAALLVVTCYLYGVTVTLPTFSKTPEFQYRFDRTFTFTFRNVKQGDSILTYNSSSLPWNNERTANSQTALYYN